MADLLSSFVNAQRQSVAANLRRYDEAMKIYDAVIGMYAPGGAFEKSSLAQLEEQKTQEVGGEMQQSISSGLYGTTTTPALGRKWEKTVGAPARLRLEDIQMQRLSEAQIGKAGFIERREDVGPDMGMLASLMGQVGEAGGGRRVGGTYGASSFPDMFSIGGEAGTPRPSAGGLGGTIYGSGTKEATEKEVARAKEAAASLYAPKDTSLEAYRRYASALTTGKQLQPGQGPIGYKAWKK